MCDSPSCWWWRFAPTDCWRGDELRQRHDVVEQLEHLYQVVHVAVVLHNLLHVVDEMDKVLHLHV